MGSYLWAYLAYPAAPGFYAAVVVGMELFGVTSHIRNVADQLAAKGYVALAPDFYHRIEPGAELTYDPAGRTRGFELLHQVSRGDALQDVQAAMHFLRRHPKFRGRIGFLGFSVGGHIGYLAATQLDLAASALFYAGWLPTTEIELSQPEPTLRLTPGMARTGVGLFTLLESRISWSRRHSANRLHAPLRTPMFGTKWWSTPMPSMASSAMNATVLIRKRGTTHGGAPSYCSPRN